MYSDNQIPTHHLLYCLQLYLSTGCQGEMPISKNGHKIALSLCVCVCAAVDLVHEYQPSQAPGHVWSMQWKSPLVTMAPPLRAVQCGTHTHKGKYHKLIIVVSYTHTHTILLQYTCWLHSSLLKSLHYIPRYRASGVYTRNDWYISSYLRT